MVRRLRIGQGRHPGHGEKLPTYLPGVVVTQQIPNLLTWVRFLGEMPRHAEDLTESATAITIVNRAGRTVSRLEVTMDMMKMIIEQSNRVCIECSRVFDMYNEEDAEEWAYGHDCEV